MRSTKLKRRNQMKKWNALLLIAFAIAFLPHLAQSQVKIKGYMMGEYYYVLNHNSGNIDDGGIEGRHGFWFRRIYFTADSQLADDIKARLRFEMNSPGKLPFDSGDQLSAVVKDVYLSYKSGRQEVLFGIISTPAFGHNIEDIWGFRSLVRSLSSLPKA